MPIFPLGTVLYPGLLLPLHIFEERYRQLVRDLVALPDDAERRFGVVAIREGREVGSDGVRALYGVGCTAELRQVEAYEDGRFDIVTVGATRFRLLTLDTSLAYLQGEVALLPELAGDSSSVLAASVATVFAAYRTALLFAQASITATYEAESGEEDEESGAEEGERPASRRGHSGLDLPEDVGVLSYLVAAAMILDLPDKQDLLAAPDVTARLRAELALLRRETTMLRLLPSLPAVDLLRQPVYLN
jgi:Lon protease-like protein